MPKVTFEFDEYEDRQDIDAIVNRHKLLCAVEELSNLYCAICNGKIYNGKDYIYLKSDGSKATEEDYKKVRDTGELLSGGEYYLRQTYIENELDRILEDVRRFLWR